MSKRIKILLFVIWAGINVVSIIGFMNGGGMVCFAESPINWTMLVSVLIVFASGLVIHKIAYKRSILILMYVFLLVTSIVLLAYSSFATLCTTVPHNF